MGDGRRMTHGGSPNRKARFRLVLIVSALLVTAGALLWNSGTLERTNSGGERAGRAQPAGERGADSVDPWEPPIEDGGTSARQNDSLDGDSWIEALVVDGNEVLQPGATVLALMNEERYGVSGIRLVMTTDSGGVARVSVPSDWPDGPIRGVATSADGAQMSDAVELPRGERERLVLAYPVHVLRGRVIGCDSSEFANGEVRAYSSNWPEAPFNGRRISLDARGEFEVHVPSGFVSLFGLIEGRAPSPVWAQKLSNHVDGVELRVGAKSRAVTLVITDEESRPLPVDTRVRYNNKGRSALVASIGKGGAVTLSHVHPAELLEVWPEPVETTDGHWRTIRGSFSIDPAEFDSKPQVRVPTASWASFSFVDAANRPAAWIPAALYSTDTSAATTVIDGVTDQSGTWEPFRRNPVKLGDSKIVVDRMVVWSGDLSVPREEPIPIRLVGHWRSMRIGLRTASGNAIASRNISVAIVGPEYSGVSDVREPERGPGIQHYEFRESDLVIAVPESLIASGRASVIERGHCERLLALPRGGESLQVTPSPSSGSLIVRSRRRGLLRLELIPQGEERGFELYVRRRAETVWGLPTGEFRWRARYGSKRYDGSVTIDAGATAEISIPFSQ